MDEGNVSGDGSSFIHTQNDILAIFLCDIGLDFV
jgi:hypothetical protein